MSGGWNTIESDAGVFTSLVEDLGIKDVQCEELFELEASELAALQPLHGVIFLFKYPTDGPYVADKPLDGDFDYAASERIFFATQTIQNACATQALLSVVLNKPDIVMGAHMRDFRDFAKCLPPDIRGEALSNSELIREVHNSFARSSPFADETRKAGDEAEDAFHFIAYTPVDGVLYELDGLQPAPIAHGPCSVEDFPAKVVDVVEKRVARYGAAEIRFNLLAVCRDLRARAEELGDDDLLESEQRKRHDWQFENALRRHNFVGFAAEMLKGVVKAKLDEGGDAAVDKWVEEGLQSLKDMEERRRVVESVNASKNPDDAMDES